MKLIKSVRDWYGRYERPLSSLSLIGCFVFDSVTPARIDLFWENFWVIEHLVIVGVFIVLVNLQENVDMDAKDASKAHFWFINILQFFFGGLLSTFIVFYFRSATLVVTLPFLLILAAAFVANESLKKHYARLTFQISLFYLSLFSFAIFIVPVLFHRIGPDVFIISGLASLAALWLFLTAVGLFAREKFRGSRKWLVLFVSIIFFGTNILYFFNLIPPIPLSLKDAGIYHSLYRDNAGHYVVTREDTGWLGYFSLHDDFHVLPGDPVYAYSAIFSPASFTTPIIHEWQVYDTNAAQETTVGRVNLVVIGGRDGGYLTYSMRDSITPGEWRLNITTTEEQIIC